MEKPPWTQRPWKTPDFTPPDLPVANHPPQCMTRPCDKWTAAVTRDLRSLSLANRPGVDVCAIISSLTSDRCIGYTGLLFTEANKESFSASIGNPT